MILNDLTLLLMVTLSGPPSIVQSAVFPLSKLSTLQLTWNIVLSARMFLEKVQMASPVRLSLRDVVVYGILPPKESRSLSLYVRSGVVNAFPRVPQ